MKFSIVVPSHNRPKHLERLLKSLTHFSKRDFEVVLVGNTGDDSYVSRLGAKYQKYLLIQTAIAGQIGVNHARNLGIRLSSGSIVVFIDDDCYFEKSQTSFFDQLDDIYMKDERISLLGGNYTLPPKKCSPTVKAYHIIAQNWFYQGLALGPFNWCLFGGCLSVRRRVFIEGNFFDESIFFGSAESEFVLRCLEKGYLTQCAPHACITHDSDITTADIIHKARSQSWTSSRFPVFSCPEFQLPLYLNFKEALLDEYSHGPLERSRILRQISTYEVNFGK